MSDDKFNPPIEPEIVEEETRLTKALVAKEQESFLERMEQVENAAAIFERRAQLLETAYLVAIRRTRPEDWVLFKDKQGIANAMLTASGAELVADVFGIQLRNIRPLDDRGIFTPDKVPVPGRTNVFTLRAWCDARSAVTGRVFENLEASRRSDEDFTGRSVDGEQKIVFRGDGALESDLRAAVQTLLRTKAVRVLCGMTRVPTSDLERAWKDSGKKLDQCRKGSGYGTSQDRTASTVTDAGVTSKAEELWKEILRRTGGDKEAADQTLKEITSYPAGKNKTSGAEYKAFGGVKSWQEITKENSVKFAWDKLKRHAQFGDQAEQREREPGED